MIVHLCSLPAWEAAQRAGEYRADSLESQGFIHASRPEQVLAVANAFYLEMANPLLLWIDDTRLCPEIRWELADGQLFPHLYGPLNLEAVVAVTPLERDPDGVFRRLPNP